MGKRSSVETLPKAVKAWLDQALIEGNFSGYSGLEEALKARGCELSRSSIHRYGQQLEERVKMLKASGEQAKALVEAVPDDEGSMSQALTLMIQEKLFTVLMSLQVDPEDIDINKIGRVIADLARASISQKKWAIEARTRLDERMKALEAEARKQTGEGQKIALDMLKKIREEAYGIFQ